nr:hypothetical protein [uncultured Psychroserpens sp.]
MIILPLIIILIILLVRVQKGMFAALLVIVVTKSILDAFWEYRIGPLSFTSFGGLLIPAIFFPILRRKKMFPNFWRKNSYFLLIAMALGLVFALPAMPFETIELILLALNVYMAFYIIPYLVNSPQRLKKILIAIILGGVFPAAVSMFQFQTGIIFQERETVGLTRYVGFYHDAFPVRFYGLFSLFSIIAYFYLIKPKRKIIKYGLIGLSFISLFSVYLVFSKAAIAIISFWTVLFIFLSKSKLKVLVSIVLIASVLFIAYGDVISSNVEQLFSKEVGFQTGDIKDARHTLAGRGYVWDDYWQFWTTEQHVFFQWFGDGIGRPTHNESFRILLLSGIIGLFFFIIYLFSIFKTILKANKNAKVLCFMLFGMYLIDCIGLDTGYYYYYNILLWGFIGLFTTRNDYFFKS